MKVSSIVNELNSLAYHGRGIIIGKSADSKKAITAYFIMGRSENSRNRVFVAEGDAMRTKAFDESKMIDPHLIIYYPVRVLGNKTIVTNGDQTDTIYDLMDKQMTFEQALRTREFEDDKPNFTPRISGIIRLEKDGMNYAMSISRAPRATTAPASASPMLTLNPSRAEQSLSTPTTVTEIPCLPLRASPRPWSFPIWALTN